MEFHQLRTFYFVATYLNFSKAAEKVSLSQPAVSRQIEALEKYYELPLFYRAGRKVELTDAGRRLLQYAERILALAEEADTALKSLKSLDSGELTVGAGTTFGNYVLSPLLMKFKNRYPKIQVKLKIEKTSVILDELRNGLIDTAVIAKTLNHPEFYIHHLASDDIILAVPYSSSIQESIELNQLSEETFFLRTAGSHTRECVDQFFQENNFQPKNIMEFDTNEAIKQSIINGYGIGMLSKSTLQTEIQHHMIRAIKMKQNCSREFITIHPKSMFPTPATLIFHSFLRKNMQRFL